jgi:hypothetical protein
MSSLQPTTLPDEFFLPQHNGKKEKLIQLRWSKIKIEVISLLMSKLWFTHIDEMNMITLLSALLVCEAYRKIAKITFVQCKDYCPLSSIVSG